MYTNNKLSKAVRLAIAFGAASATAFTASVNAAEEDETAKVERIEVTGSRIKRTDLETSSPIQITSAEEIKLSGFTNLAICVATTIPILPLRKSGNETVARSRSGLSVIPFSKLRSFIAIATGCHAAPAPFMRFCAIIKPQNTVRVFALFYQLNIRFN